MQSHARCPAFGLMVALHLVGPGSARGQAREPREVEARSSTYVRYFERAFVPGPIGVVPETQSMAPVSEYLELRAVGIDTPVGTEGARVELSGWGNGLVTDVAGEHRFDGDVTALTLLVPFGPFYAKLGRQIVTSPAARWLRIDGALVGAGGGMVRVDAYGGYVVLPRWSERPGYFVLTGDGLTRAPLAAVTRAGCWATGGRVEIGHPSWGKVGASIHEARRSSELYARNLAADVLLTPWRVLDLSGVAIVDASGPGLAEARTDVALRPLRDLDVTLEYRRTDPMLFLPRDSVLGVFDTSRLDEIGADVAYRPLERLSFGAAGYGDAWTDQSTGLRLSARMLAGVDPSGRVRVALAYGRAVETKNGYHTARLSISYRFADPADAVLEHQAYFYDHPIRDVATSTVDEASVGWRFAPAFSTLLGATITRSPYALLDAQMLLRLVYDTEVVP